MSDSINMPAYANAMADAIFRVNYPPKQNVRRADAEAELQHEKALLPKLREDVDSARGAAIPQLRSLILSCHREIADLQGDCNFVAIADLSEALGRVKDAAWELDAAAASLKAAERHIEEMQAELDDAELWKVA